MANPRFEVEEVQEGATKLMVPKSEHARGPKAKEGVPFYNPDMRLARDISVRVLTALASESPRPLTVCDAMSSLGARGIRFANEVPNVHVTCNDPNLDAIHLAKQNADRLGLRNFDWRLGRLETLLMDHRFDWVDIDPFGTPAPYIDVAIPAVNDGGILAITATDKAALCGVYADACLRRYNARPLHGVLMWEIATRILISAIARAAGRRDRSIEPLLAHSTNHYVRVYARVNDGAAPSSKQAREYAYAWMEGEFGRHLGERPPPEGDYAGPLWAGPTANEAFLAKLLDGLPKGAPRDLERTLRLLKDECPGPPLYYTIDEFTRHLKTNAPRLERVLERLRQKGRVATRTHYTPRGFKTDATVAEISSAVKASD